MTTTIRRSIKHGKYTSYEACARQKGGACSKCKKAWASYYLEYKRTHPEAKVRQKIYQKSARLAKSDLAIAHHDEYRELYYVYRDKLMKEAGLI